MQCLTMLMSSLPYQVVWHIRRDLSYFLLGQLHIHHKPIDLLNFNGFYDNLLSFLDQAVEQKFLTSSARQIIISTATAEQLIDQLQSFIPIIDPSMSRINWSTMESRKKLRLDLSLVCETLCLLVLLIAYYFVLLFLIFV